MSLLNPRLLIVGCMALLGCATDRPLFEQEFINGSPRALHDAWMRTLQERYGCDTVVVRHEPLLGQGTRAAFIPRYIEVGPDVNGQYSTISNPNGPDGPFWATPPSGRGYAVGATPCDMAYAYPTVVRVWATPDGIREDWMQGHVVWYQFSGPDTLNLRLNLVLMP
jgi:hypothetical protein